MRHLIFIVLVFLSIVSMGQKDSRFIVEEDRIKKITYHEEGNIRETGYYDLKGNRIGVWIMYHINGNVSMVGEFRNGLKHNEWSVYNSNGELISKMFYKDGKRTGTWEIYRNGELAQTKTY